MVLLLQLFYEYFKVGLFAIGGGLATIPFLSELGERTAWFTQADLADMIAISESTPGPIGINMASNIGFKLAGIPGVIFATFGVVAPSVIVIIAIISIMNRYNDSPVIKSAFYGLRPASLALMSVACLEVAKVAFFDTTLSLENIIGAINYKAIILGVVLFIAIKKIKIHPIFFILISAFIGIIFNFAA